MANHPGNDTLIDYLLEGKTYTEIAELCDAGLATVHRWVMAEDIAEKTARAREESAEAWLDRGLAPLREALQKGSAIDASAARAYAQECARRAAIRNPRYREASKVEADVKAALTIQVVKFGDDQAAE